MWRYALTIFLSAFLLFQVQPLIAKFILPWFGGGPGVWTACMLFFQVALLVGYIYAHLVVMRLKPKHQMWLHLGLLIAALAMLPIIPDEAWKPQPDHHPVGRILLLLAVTIGLPFIALSATAPLLQAWFARTHVGRSPYRLYALSNAGSLLALLSYPFVLEPLLTRQTQAMLWTWGFVAFAAMCAFVAVSVRQSAVDSATAIAAEPARESPLSKKKTNRRKQMDVEMNQQPLASSPAKSTIALWLLLPACAVVLLLSITSQLSEEVAPVPFLWVATLAVYLLTFILCFEWSRLYHRGVFTGLVLIALWIVWLMLIPEMVNLTLQLAAYLFMLFAGCMVCHGELHRLRPEPTRLTAFYLCIAAGGALGGTFVSIIAPIIFTSNLEFYFSLYGTLALLLVCCFRDPGSIFHQRTNRLGWLSIILVAMMAGFLTRVQATDLEQFVVMRTRNFYGSLSLKVFPNKENPNIHFRRLDHGRIAHGGQHIFEDSMEIRRQPALYYGPDTGVGIAMRHWADAGPMRVGIVGLGAGGCTVYSRPGDVYRYYEIDHQVERYAEEHFTYLADARALGATVEVVLNDARLALEQEPPQKFDVLVLDAFSGDAIPIHLLTLEAFQIYERHLAEDGVIVAHVSNRYLELRPVVHRIADELGFTAVSIVAQANERLMYSESTWVIVSRNQDMLAMPDIQQEGLRPTQAIRARLWTDDHHSLFEVLK